MLKVESCYGCRFPRMTKLCAHVRMDHNTDAAIIEQAEFENYDQVHHYYRQYCRNDVIS